MKKLILLVLVVAIGMLLAVRDHKSGETDTITTTAAYAKATDTEIVCQDYDRKFILIKNVGVSNSMYYTVWGYANNGSSYYEELVAETSIAASGSDYIKLSNTAYAKIVIRVKNNAGATTCKISYNMTP